MTDHQYVFCPNCGQKNNQGDKFCTNCGQKLPLLSKNADNNSHVQKEKKENVIDATTSRINDWAGGNGAVKINLRSFFGQVFKHHSEEEAEEIFIVGTDKTTPPLTSLVNDNVQPWLFSRALVFTLILAGLLWVLSIFNPRIGVAISLDAILSVSVPVSALILFFEINVYKNISFYKVIQIFLTGGALSLIVAMIIDSFLGNSGEMNFTGTLITGIAEELGKVLVAGYFIYRLNTKYVLNGLLIGAAVGSGFASFENIMYMVNDQTGQLVTVSQALLRALSSISDHTEWCAITAAALVLVKGADRLTVDCFFKPRFLKFLGSVIMIHMLWDWSIVTSNLKYVILAILTWLFVFVLIHAGLKEVKQLQLTLKQDADR